jgi:hypothetical protein
MRAALLLLAACAGGKSAGTARSDSGTTDDAVPAVDAAPPYRHTITIDGTDDFAQSETLPTTSAGYTAKLAWDDVNLYIGYAGPDLATGTSDAAQKWLFVYLDTTSGGETQSEMYNTQRATFPTGFEADTYVRYKVNGTTTSLEQVSAGDWMTAPPAPQVGQAGTFVELAIPLAQIGAGDSLRIVTYMINEKMFAEGTYAGLFADNFVDGYAANMVLTRSYAADFLSSRAPAD